VQPINNNNQGTVTGLTDHTTEQDNNGVAYNKVRRWGAATVINTDTIYNGSQLQDDPNRSNDVATQPVLYTTRGATVINVPSGKNAAIKYTNRGATITTNL